MEEQTGRAGGAGLAWWERAGWEQTDHLYPSLSLPLPAAGGGALPFPFGSGFLAPVMDSGVVVKAATPGMLTRPSMRWQNEWC